MRRYDAYSATNVDWLGDIPASWSCANLGVIARQRKNLNKDGDVESVLSLSYGKIKRRVMDNSGLLPESFNTYNVIESGDVVLRLTDLQNDQRSLRVGLCHERGIITAAYVTLEPTAVNSRYLYYSLAVFDFWKGFYGLAGGVRQSLTFDGIRNLRFPLPSKGEQIAIADYLDAKTAEIDVLMADCEREVELLQEYRKAVISEAVTKGLDPTVAMKESGIDWIGEIPTGWETSTIFGVTSLITNGYVGPTRDLFVDSGVRYLQSLHIVNGAIDFDKHPYYVPEEWSALHSRSVLSTGDVLVVQTGAIGNCAYVFDVYAGSNCHALIVLRSDDAVMVGRYLYYYLLSDIGKEKLLLTRTGATHPHLNSTKIRFVSVLVPPLDEQRAIADYLDTKTAEIDSLIADKRTLIDKLREYRKSLISEIVTGKIKVPGV